MKKSIKVTVITVVKNGLPYLDECIQSVKLQSYKNIEHIIVYSASSDGTYEFLKKTKNIKLIKQTKKNIKGKIYDAINIGLKHANGEIIGLLHSDDIFCDQNTITNIVNCYNKNKFDICYGNLIIANKNNLQEIIRNWKTSKFSINKFNYGWMPPHPTIFIQKKYKTIKYNTNYKISSDYEYILNIFDKKKKIYFLDNYITIMRYGGTSTQKFSSYILKFIEDWNILKKKFKFHIIILTLKILTKTNQINLLNIKKYNFKKNDLIFEKIINKKIEIFSNFNSLFKKKKFVFSAFNLAWIAFVFDKVDILKNHMVIWPDGIFAKFYLKREKISGRKLLKSFKFKRNIKNVYLIGKKDFFVLRYLKKKFYKSKIIMIDLPFAKIDELIKIIDLKKKRFLSNSYFFISLPTPKQEIIASRILYSLKDSKIFCFGGALFDNSRSINPPNILIEKYFEYLWRLRSDTFRRIVRLLISFIYFLKKKLTNQVNLNVK